MPLCTYLATLPVLIVAYGLVIRQVSYPTIYLDFALVHVYGMHLLPAISSMRN